MRGGKEIDDFFNVWGKRDFKRKKGEWAGSSRNCTESFGPSSKLVESQQRSWPPNDSRVSLRPPPSRANHQLFELSVQIKFLVRYLLLSLAGSSRYSLSQTKMSKAKIFNTCMLFSYAMCFSVAKYCRRTTGRGRQ
jgi:hypothetical protein